MAEQNFKEPYDKAKNKASRQKVQISEKTVRKAASFARKNKALVLILVVCLLAVLSFGKYIHPSIPGWSDVLTAMGIYEQPVAVDGQAVVDFVDVGQGDCTVIRSGGEVVVIDAGDISTANLVLDFLKKNQISKVNRLIITHPHADHIGAAAQIILNYNVEEVMMSKIPDNVLPTSAVFERMLDAVAKTKVKATYVQPGTSFPIGQGTMTILGPVQEYDDLNNSSIVCRYVYGNKSFLFTGDMEKSAENDLVASGCSLSSDVLKVGHHASKTSSGKTFMQRVMPKYGVFFCETGNKYGFPHEVTMNTLKSFGVEILRTDTMGTITMTTDGMQIQIKTEK